MILKLAKGKFVPVLESTIKAVNITGLIQIEAKVLFALSLCGFVRNYS
jgi:hypothetical protein